VSHPIQPILTVRDITIRWKCSRRTVLDVIHSGELHAFRLGKRAYRARLVDVEAYEARKAA
jgi:excisionase family DNA binding protein